MMRYDSLIYHSNKINGSGEIGNKLVQKGLFKMKLEW